MALSLLYCSMCGAYNESAATRCFACGRALEQGGEDEDTRDVPLRGRYVILSQLGTGGFGAVSKAADTHSHERLVAIKQINLRGLSPQQTIEATDGFNREVQLLSALAHPRLPCIHDHFTDAEHWYLVMDFIEGQTLEHYLRGVAQPSSQAVIRALPLDEVLDIGLQLCDVLAYLHAKQPPVIFRDLKPANIMRGPHGRLFLIDFGIARHFKPGQPRDTMPFGSPGYAAPEQYGRAQTSPRADIYSLGALLYHLLARVDPAETPLSFAPLGQFGQPGLAELERLRQRMVELDASRRPASIAEVGEELRRIVTLRARGEPRIWQPPAGQSPPPANSFSSWSAAQQQQVMSSPAARSARRTFLARSLAVGGAIVVGGGFLLSAINGITPGHSFPPSGQEPPMVNPLLFLQGHLEAVNEVAWSPNGQYLASASSDATVRVWDMMKRHTVHIYQAFASSVQSVAWSHTAHYIAAGAYGQDTAAEVQIWDAVSRRSVYRYRDGPNAAINSVSWSPRETLLAVGYMDGTVQVLQVSAEGQVRPLSTFQGHISATTIFGPILSWSANGRLIASIGEHNALYVWDAMRGGRPDRGQSVSEGVVTVVYSPSGSQIAFANVNGAVAVWDGSGPQGFSAYTTETGDVSMIDVAWSPDARYLVGVGGSEICIWDTSLGANPLYSLSLADRVALSVAWSPGLTRSLIAISYIDGSIGLWPAPVS